MFYGGCMSVNSKEDKTPGSFYTTRWSMIFRAKEAVGEDRNDALEYLFLHYWRPLYQYFRYSGFGIEEAEDATQSLFVGFMDGRLLKNVVESKGRFRSYLLACAKNYQYDCWRKNNRQKRVGSQRAVPLDTVRAEAEMEWDSPFDPEVLYDMRWAQQVLERVLARLRKECERKGQPFELLKPYVLGGSDTLPYHEAAVAAQVSTAAFKGIVFRMRKQFAQLFRSEVAETVDVDADTDLEVRYLIGLIANAVENG